jgi:hypothetical protein
LHKVFKKHIFWLYTPKACSEIKVNTLVAQFMTNRNNPDIYRPEEKMQSPQPDEALLAYVRELVARHGEVVGGDALRLLLGFPSIDAMKRAIARGTLALPTFLIRGRRGRFALTVDIAKYLLDAKNAGGRVNRASGATKSAVQ